MKLKNQKTEKRLARHRRVRAKVIGTAERPRVTVFRSNRHIFVQIVDDSHGRTLASSKVVAQSKSKLKGTKVELAQKIGELVAKTAKNKGITAVVFDRGGFKFHGRVKALADGLKAGGLEF